MLSVYKRFENCQGRELEDEVDKEYIMQSTLLPFFSPNGQRTFVRHSINNRNQKDTREKYVDLLLQHGMLKSVRAAPKAVPTSSDPHHWQLQLLTHAHLIEALYLAAERHPENRQVQISMKEGISVHILYQAGHTSLAILTVL